MANIEIVVLEKEDLPKFSHLFYDELLLNLPEDALMLGAVETTLSVPRAAGILIFHLRNSCAYIDWLYVDNDFRKRGIGKALINDLKQIFVMDPDAAIEVVFMDYDETVRGMGRFLKKNKFAVTFYDGNFNIYAPLKSVKLMAPAKNRTSRLSVLPLSEVPSECFEKFDNYLDLVENEYVGVIGPIDPKGYRPESRAVLDGTRIVGIMLVGDTIYEDTVIIDWVYSIPKYVVEAVPLAFDTVITDLKKTLPENTMISMASLTENVGAIIRKTMPGAVFTESYSAFWLVER